MARLIYASNMSLDGCTEDERGGFDWASPDDDVVEGCAAMAAILHRTSGRGPRCRRADSAGAARGLQCRR